MSINLLDMVKSVAGDALIKQASSFIGENEGATSKALGAILPSLLGSVIQKGSTERGASGLMDFLTTNKMDGGILANLGSLLGGGGSSADTLLGSGSGILKFLMGDKLSGVIDLVTKFTGLKTGSSSTLLKLGAPILMNVVGKYIKTAGLNALSLKNLLGTQKSIVHKALPSEFSSLLGFADFDKSDIPSTATPPKSATGGMNWWPYLVGAAVILCLMYFLRNGCANKVTETVQEAAAQVDTAVTDAANTVTDAVADVINSISLPGGVELKAKAGSFMDNLAKYVGSTETADPTRAFIFDNLNFETGSDKITAESQAQLDDLTAVLTAYPVVNLKVAGHTDNVGAAAANKTLSESRAKSVKAYLVGKGIKGNRIETEGWGQDKPIVANDTEEGKAMNRRVEVYITKK